MKIAIPTDKIKEFVLAHDRLLIWTTIGIFVVIFIIGSYFALNPITNPDAKAAGEQKLEDLNITFDKKTLDSLQNELAPSVINGQGGRNPFSAY